jgi:hypothetical protein
MCLRFGTVVTGLICLRVRTVVDWIDVSQSRDSGGLD